MPLDKGLKTIFDYIFFKKGRLRAKTPSEAILAAYLVVLKAELKDEDKKRGTQAGKAYMSLQHNDIKQKLDKIKKTIDNGDFDGSINQLKEFIKNSVNVKEYINSKRLLKKSVFSKPDSLSVDKEKIKDAFMGCITRHPGTIPSEVVDKIEKGSNEGENAKCSKGVSEKNKARKQEAITRNKIEEIVSICNSIYKKKYNAGKYSRKVLNRSLDYADCIYISENKTVHRIIVGKKGAISKGKFSILSPKKIDTSLKSKLKDAMGLDEDSKVYKFNKVAEGKTKEKYEYTRKDNGEKKEFSYRYKVYCDYVVDTSAISNLVSLYLAPAIFEKLGYKIKYNGDKNKKPKYGALGTGSFNAAYEEDNQDKKIKRVIKICISGREAVMNERKGNKRGCQAFESIKEFDTSGKNIREIFYQNEDLVLNKNKEFGQVSDILEEKDFKDINSEADLWYCIATSEFRSDGDAEKFDSDYVEKFNNSETEKLIELQAFTKGILNGLVKMHKRGIVHLDVKPENTLKKLSGNESAPYYKYSLTDFGTAIDIKKRANEELTWKHLLDGMSSGTAMYGRNQDDKRKLLVDKVKVEPELIYKFDSFAVATSMCAFYKFYLTGKSDKTNDTSEGGYTFPWKYSEQHDKGSESALITWLPEGDARDLAKKLMEKDLEKRWSCEQALQHGFITKKIN